MKQDIGACWIKISLFFALVLQGGCETTSHTFKVNAMKKPGGGGRQVVSDCQLAY